MPKQSPVSNSQVSSNTEKENILLKQQLKLMTAQQETVIQAFVNLSDDILNKVSQLREVITQQNVSLKDISKQIANLNDSTIKVDSSVAKELGLTPEDEDGLLSDDSEDEDGLLSDDSEDEDGLLSDDSEDEDGLLSDDSEDEDGLLSDDSEDEDGLLSDDSEDEDGLLSDDSEDEDGLLSDDSEDEDGLLSDDSEDEDGLLSDDSEDEDEIPVKKQRGRPKTR